MIRTLNPDGFLNPRHLIDLSLVRPAPLTQSRGLYADPNLHQSFRIYATSTAPAGVVSNKSYLIWRGATLDGRLGHPDDPENVAEIEKAERFARTELDRLERVVTEANKGHQ